MMETVRNLSEVNLKKSAAISRFSGWILTGTIVATVLFVSRYDSVGSFTGPSVIPLSILLFLFSFALGVAQKVVSVRLVLNSKNLIDNQILLTVFQTALIVCVVLLFGVGVAITRYAA